MNQLFRRVRHLLGLRPPYEAARASLEAALATGELVGSQPIETAARDIHRICGWNWWFDGPDGAELEMEAEHFGLQVHTVDDYIRLLRRIDEGYES